MDIVFLASRLDGEIFYENLKINREIERAFINTIDKSETSINILDKKTFVENKSKNCNIILAINDDEKIDYEDDYDNLIVVKEDMFELFNQVNSILSDYSLFYSKLYQKMLNKSSINDLLLYISSYFDSKICLLNSNKKLIENPFNFYTVNKLYPLEVKRKNLSKTFAYLGLEDFNEDYDSEFIKLSEIISDFLYDNVKNLLDSKKDIYPTLKNLVYGNFSDKDEKILKNIGWSLNDDYLLVTIKLNGGLFKYQEMFTHGNQFALDYTSRLFSIILDNNLLIIINRDIKDNWDLKEKMTYFINKYKLDPMYVSLNKNLLNLKNAYELTNNLIYNGLQINSLLNNNIYEIGYDLMGANKYSQILISDKILKLKEYEEDNGGDLLKTLYYYLMEERSLIKASQKLDIHRNSIVYRINKINEIVNLDLDDYESRNNILASLELLDRLEPDLAIRNIEEKN
ncbi:MAG: helix-turn-helix domain-containing protein [Finegoldia sp.]|nr:helix-turn-helix domain-containing protein [Finegoldia sp.]